MPTPTKAHGDGEPQLLLHGGVCPVETMGGPIGGWGDGWAGAIRSRPGCRATREAGSDRSGVPGKPNACLVVRHDKEVPPCAVGC